MVDDKGEGVGEVVCMMAKERLRVEAMADAHVDGVVDDGDELQTDGGQDEAGGTKCSIFEEEVVTNKSFIAPRW